MHTNLTSNTQLKLNRCAHRVFFNFSHFFLITFYAVENHMKYTQIIMYLQKIV